MLSGRGPGVAPELISGMDETGCPPEDACNVRVVGSRESKSQAMRRYTATHHIQGCISELELAKEQCIIAQLFSFRERVDQ